MPKIAEFYTRLGCDERLYAKYKAIDVNALNAEQRQALKNALRGFILGGAEERFTVVEVDPNDRTKILSEPFSITFPQILLIMAPSLIQQFIGNINNFNVIYFLTGGGPTNSSYYQAGSTNLLVTWLYKLTVSAKDYNLASVIGILIFAISAAFSLLAYTRSASFKEGTAK